jgi:hypothetical protein
MALSVRAFYSDRENAPLALEANVLNGSSTTEMSTAVAAPGTETQLPTAETQSKSVSDLGEEECPAKTWTPAAALRDFVLVSLPLRHSYLSVSSRADALDEMFPMIADRKARGLSEGSDASPIEVTQAEMLDLYRNPLAIEQMFSDSL